MRATAMNENSNSLIENLLFLPLDLPAPPKINAQQIEEAKKISFIRDDFRNCFHIPLFNADGSNIDFKNSTTENLCWTEASLKLPQIKKYILDTLSWIRPMGRIVLICTPPNTENPIHLDCTSKDILNPHVKFRAVLQGNSSSLWFWDGSTRHHVPEVGSRPFIMAGNFPHGMTNNTDTYKYTLAIGTPWDAKEEDTIFVEIFKKSLSKEKMNFLSKDNVQYPQIVPTWLAK